MFWSTSLTSPVSLQLAYRTAGRGRLTRRGPHDTHAEPLHLLQEGRVRQWLVGQDLLAIRRPDRLTEDGDISHLRLQI
jgi:hypothetical protein